MKKRNLPCMLFNKTTHIYPNGLRVTDEDDRCRKLDSGWNTGPVDNKNNAPKKEKGPVAMTVPELIAAAKQNGMTIIEDTQEEIPGGEAKETETPETSEATPEKTKPVDDMLIDELKVEAGKKGITILDGWIKKDILAAIKAHKE